MKKNRLNIRGVPKKSDEEMLIDAKEFILNVVDQAMMAVYGSAIMGIGNLDELESHFYNCVIESKHKYKDMTKGEFVDLVEHLYKEL